MPLFAVLVFPLIGGDQSWLQTYYTHTTIDGFRFTIKYSREKSDLCLIGSVPSSLSYKTFLFFPYFHISFNNWKNKYILDHFLHGLSFGPDGRLCQLLWRQTFFHFETVFFIFLERTLYFDHWLPLFGDKGEKPFTWEVSRKEVPKVQWITENM